MGYECPVCATPQADARHLANHMAFTAVLGDAEHETWLDEHAPGWSEAGEAELAPRVAEHAPEAEFDQVFEDTVGGLEESDPTDPAGERSGALFDDRGHDHAHGHDAAREPSAHGPEELDDETRAVLEEARDMTREMLADGKESTETDADGGGDDSDDGQDVREG